MSDFDDGNTLKVTVENLDSKTKRSYKGNYALAFVMTDIGQGRWVQEPNHHNDGLAMFVAALTALREVAAIRGDEMYKVAARRALEEMEEIRKAKVIAEENKYNV